ncbi:hypothetical protein D3C76_721190 [compost metagenome]
MYSALASHLLDVSAVDDPELQTEFFYHLDTPLFLQRGGTDDQDSADTMAKQHLLDDQACFDRFAETYVIGDQQIDTRHIDRTYKRIQLKVLEAHTATKRRLEEATISISSSPPAYGIKKGF